VPAGAAKLQQMINFKLQLSSLQAPPLAFLRTALQFGSIDTTSHVVMLA